MKFNKIILIVSVFIAVLLLGACATTKAEYDTNGEIIEPASYGKCSLGQYKGLKATETVLPVTDEDIDISIKYWRNRGDESPEEELREQCREDLEISMQNAAREQVITDLVEQVIEKSSFTLNETAVDYQYQELQKYYKEFAEYNGMTIENFISLYAEDEESFNKEVKASAEKIVKEILVKKAIFDKEKMTLTEEEMADEKNAISDKVKEFLYNNADITKA